MKNSFWIASIALGATLIVGTARADHRIFTYTYEPEAEPKGDLEYEQSVTFRAGRNSAVGQRDYSRWQFRHPKGRPDQTIEQSGTTRGVRSRKTQQ